MPEIPDLNVFCTNLAKRLVGKTLTNIDILVPRRLKKPEAAFKEALQEQELVAVTQLGKQLYFEFRDHVLSVQLMLYGSMHWYEGKNDNKFTITELLFEDGTGLAITDWQKAVILTLDPQLSKVPDAMHLPEGYLAKALKGKTKPIKTVLQEGKVVQASAMLMSMRSSTSLNCRLFLSRTRSPSKRSKYSRKPFPRC
jgi:formamidopyrimidine-DNA glycosylase